MELKIRPSEAHRWLQCTASPRLVAENKARIPEDSTVYAVEGTLAHTLAAEAFLLGFDKGEFEDPEMAIHVEDYMAYVKSYLKDNDAETLIEQKITTFYNPKQTGYVDATVCNDHDFAVVDLKYGAGVSVAAEENEQLLIYGLSVAEALKKKGYRYSLRSPVTLAIYQPRVRGEDAERVWKMPLGELLERGKPIAETAKKILSGDPGKFSPSEDVCKWCDAKAFCGAYAKGVLDGFPKGPKFLGKREVKMPQPETLHDEALVRVLRRLPDLTKWANSVKRHCSDRLKRGDKITGLKLVDGGLGNRVWADEDGASEYLSEYLPEDVVHVKSLISPAQAEKALKLEKVEDFSGRIGGLVNRPEKGPSLAFADSPKPDWQGVKAEEEFEPITEKPKNEKTKK